VNAGANKGLIAYFNSRSLFVASAANNVTSRREDAASVADRNIVSGGVFDSSTTPDVICLWKADAPTVAQVTSFSTETTTSEATTNYGANPAWLGSRNDGASLPLNGAIREFLLIPARVPDAVLQLLMHALSLKAEIA
jgi:hypothetical protein